MRNKLERFSDNAVRKNVIEPGKEIFSNIKGNWHQRYFENTNPIVLELGCGKGEYTTGLARLYPDHNYIGVDVKGARIWVGSSMAIEENLKNVAFLRIRILDIDQLFNQDEVAGIWITFPDPQPKKRDTDKRLTSPRFIELYKKIMKPGGMLHFKTDNKALFEYTLETLQERKDIQNPRHTFDLYQSDLLRHHHGITTSYERKFVDEGLKIHYLQCNITA